MRVTGGQAHESRQTLELLMAALEAVTDDAGEVRCWPLTLAGDKGYRSEVIDELLLSVKVRPVIPSKRNEKTPRAAGAAFDKQLYKGRNIVERLLGWLKRCRRVCTRYEKTLTNFLGMLKLAMIRRLLGIRLPARKGG